MNEGVLSRVEAQIRDVYVWWSEQAPGVTPREEGVLADLWAQADFLYELIPELTEKTPSDVVLD